MKRGLVIRLLTRLVSLILVWDLLSLMPEVGIGVPNLLPAGIADIHKAFLAILFYACVLSVTATVITGSPTLYVITLALIVVLRYHTNPVVPTASIGGLYIVLALDTAGFVYREGQEKSIKYVSSLALPKAALLCLMLLLVYALPSIFAGDFILLLATILQNSPSPIARVLGENVVFKLFLVMVLTSLVYKLLSDVTEILSVLAFPTKKAAFRAIVSVIDVDVIYRAPLEFVKVLIITSFIAPLLYVVLLDYAFPLVLSLLGIIVPPALKSALESWWLRLVLAVALLALSWWLASRLLSFYEELKLKGAFITSIALVLVLYVMAVYYRFNLTRDLAYALLNPEFGFIETGVRKVYYDYYVNFIYLFEAISALMGFTP